MAESSIQEKREKRRERRRKALQSSSKNSAKKAKATPSESTTTIAEPSGGGSGNPVVRSLVSVRDYFLGVRSELDKVTWPTRDEATRLTWIVSGVTVASALFLGGLSIIFTELFNLGVNQPLVFIVVFVVFLGLLYGYSQFISRSTPTDY